MNLNINFKEKNKRIQEIKEKCKSILEEEANKNGVSLNIEPITIVEYYKSDVFKNKTKLQKIGKKLSLINTGGFFDSSNQKILVFLDRMGKYEKADSPNRFTAALFASYHEFRHQLQYLNKDINPTAKFIINLEGIIKTYARSDYKLNHDKYYMEIDANSYALNKTDEYFKENEPEKYESTKDYLNKRWGISTQYHLNNYDFQKTFTKFYLISKVKRLKFNSLNIPELNIFFNEKNKFRNLSEILELFKKSNLDESILHSILGSSLFIRQLNIKSLSNEEKQFISNILTVEIEKEKRRIEENTKNYENRKINCKEYLKSCKEPLKKIKFISKEVFNLSELFLRKRKKLIPTLNTKILQKTNQKLTSK